MTLSLLLPWFPILLTVGLGGRLLGRGRGFALGLLAALFWVALLQASLGRGVWHDGWAVATILTGAVAIVAMGGWAGETAGTSTALRRRRGAVGVLEIPSWSGGKPACQEFTQVFDEFHDWIEEHRNDSDPWPKFDEWVRGALYRCCQATHVKPYRLLPEGDALVPLREADPFVETRPLSARTGIVGHVLTTGRTYLAEDNHSGELLTQLAAENKEAIAWCFAIRRAGNRLGLITVGQVGLSPGEHRDLLATVERMICHFWCRLREVCEARQAVLDDPVSGLFTREALLREAERTLADSYRQGEPVAVAVIALEGLRDLNDAGRWEVADELLRAVGNALRGKVRSDDKIGCFDGSRFLLLLRRVDSQLAHLIIAQVVARLRSLCGDTSRWGASVGVRCGVVGSGTGRPDLRTLISGSLIQWRRARASDIPIASDLPVTAAAAKESQHEAGQTPLPAAALSREST